MKKTLAALALIALLSLGGCATHKETSSEDTESNAGGSLREQETISSGNELSGAREELDQAAPSPEGPDESRGQTDALVEVVVGDRVFEMRLYSNETSNAFLELLPLKIVMDDLHANEKYLYLEEGLPTNASPIYEAHAGDLYLYGSDCLVFFYEAFTTSYSYSPIGAIDNPAGFADAVGRSSVEVHFRAVV